MPAAVKQASFSGVGAYRMLTEAPNDVSNYNFEGLKEEPAVYRVSLFQLVNEICGSHVFNKLYYSLYIQFSY